MRVTARTFYKDYAQTVQDLHSDLNRSIEQVSSERKYDSAEDNPLAYYESKRIDNQYTDADTKNTVINDVKNRLYQQEEGALSIQKTMRSIDTDLLKLNNGSDNFDLTMAETMKTDLVERMNTMENTLNTTYENYYVYGGNDMTTMPFTFDEDLEGTEKGSDGTPSITLNFAHKFPGESDITTTMSVKYTLDDDTKTVKAAYSGTRKGTAADGTAVNETMDEDTTLEYIKSAMMEEGRMSLGYGTLNDRETLPDTFTGGLNMLTGIDSSGLKAMNQADSSKATENIRTQMTQTPIALTAQAILADGRYIKTLKGEKTGDEAFSVKDLNTSIGDVLGKWDDSEQRVSNTYRELGIRENALEDTQTRLASLKQSLQSQYTDKVGIDTYDAIVKMYSQQYAYNAAIRVGSNIMQSSLFDYVRS